MSALIALAAFAACGGDDSKIFDPDSFSGMHENEIKIVCQHTVDCKVQAQGPGAVPPNPYTACQQQTVTQLETMPDKRSQFLSNYARCQHFVGCQYTGCASTSALGFGDSQMMNIGNLCEQNLACRAEQGESIADHSGELATCVDFYVMELNAYTGSEEDVFRTAYRGCASLTGCQFTSCLWPEQ